LNRLVSLAVPIVLIAIFLSFNQYLFSNNCYKKSTKEAVTIDASPKEAVHGEAHSDYPQRTMNNRYFTNRPPAAIDPGQNIHKPGNTNSSEDLSMKSAVNDLLRSGYLKDIESTYIPAFGNSR
jgi:hypothetical protein